MAYTTPRTWNNELATAANFNTELKDNQIALKDPPSGNYEANEAGNYTTSSLTYGNVDGTAGKFSQTITTTGGDVMIGFHASVNTTNSRFTWFDVTIDGVSLAGYDAVTAPSTALAYVVIGKVGFVRVKQGLSAGAHTFNLVWRNSHGAPSVSTLYAGAGTANYDVHPQFWVRELT